jgi:hypothetical protein
VDFVSNEKNQWVHGIRPSDLQDALLLLAYAAEAGVEIDEGIADVLAECSVMLASGPSERGESVERDAPLVSAATFYSAYQVLSSSLQPVTAQTLRDTSRTWNRRTSYAGRWSLWLMAYTVLFLSLIVFEQFIGKVFLECYSDEHNPCKFAGAFRVKTALEMLVPFAYGGLGACAYLLVSCHRYIVTRTFQRIRRFEYWSRLLLGVIAGGTILLYIELVIIEDGTQINISSAALAFLAGYNVDLLFQTMDRIMAVILPKAGLDSIAKNKATGTLQANPVDLEALVAQLNSAQDETTRAAIARLLDRLSSR